MATRKKLTREERLEKKREAERIRYQRIKNDPEKYAQQKDKERKKYERKKEKGTIKTVNKMTPREQRKARKLWREKAAKRRRRLALKNSGYAPITPPSSDDEAPRPALIPLNENIDKRAEAAKQRSIRARKARNLLIQKQADQIAKLKSTVLRYKKRQQRSRKVESQPEEPIPNTKVNQLIESPSARKTLKKKTTVWSNLLVPTTSGRKELSNGDFVLVKLIHRETEYRYVSMCTGVEEDNEIQVIFCKICDNTGKNFKIDENDIAFIQWDQIKEDPPIPNIKMRGQRMFYSFHDSINVIEQS